MMSTIERRITDAKIEIRNNADGTVGLRGYAAVFDSVAHGEVVRRSAFSRTIDQRDNARLLVNHDGVPLASVKAGTMTLSVDDRGLLVDAPNLDPKNPTVQELVSAMNRGDIDQMSFAFTASDDPVVSGVRELREVKLYDVSVVTYPWYEATTVSPTGRATSELVSLRRSPEMASLLEAKLRAAPAGKTSFMDVADELCEQIAEALGVTGECIYVADLGADWAVYYCYDGDWDMFLVDYTTNTDGTFTIGAPTQVEAITEYRPLSAEELTEENTEDELVRSIERLVEARALLAA